MKTYTITKNTNWIKFSNNEYRIFTHNENECIVISCNKKTIEAWEYLYEITFFNAEINSPALLILETYHFISAVHQTDSAPVINLQHLEFKLILQKKLRYSFPIVKDELIRREIFSNPSMPFSYHHPDTVFLDITYNCNLKCGHCYVAPELNNFPNTVFSNQSVIKIIEHLAKHNIRTIIIIGGEPFIDPNILQYIELAKKYHIGVTVVTNGTSDKIAEFIPRLKTLDVELEFSLDGHKEKSHAKLRGENNFQLTLNNIRLAKKNGIRTVVDYTVTRQNFWSIIPTFFLCNKLKVNEFLLIPFVASGQGKINKKKFQLTQYHHLLLKRIQTLLTIFSHFTYTHCVDLNNYCSGLIAPTINFKGQIFFCVNFDKNFPLGNISQKNITTWWKENQHYRNKNLIKEPCSSCRYKKSCGTSNCRAAMYSQYGDFWAGNNDCLKGKISSLINKVKFF